MKKTTPPARLVVTRTPAINRLLQEAWTLSPELKEKISLTVYQAIVALVRERKRYKAFALEPFNSPPVNMAKASIGETAQGAEDSIAGDFTTEEANLVPRENDPHPDSIWND